MFNKVTQKHKCPLCMGVIDCQSVRPRVWQDFSTPKVCVQNVYRVLEVERKL